ncbi:MAG: SH3 domain-containing protein [Chloroflexi bacterium]|nr:SH3 domain-containing protein [Chloroflexota bacterium]
MKKLTAFLFSVIVFAGLVTAPPPQANARLAPLVLAFYYNWYDENTWKPSVVPDMPVLKYLSRDPINTARQIVEARNAGIDALVVSWWGQGNPTEDNFKAMLEQARGLYYNVAIDFELTSPFYHNRDDVIRSLRYLIATHAQHPAYLKVNGKPVIFFWREQKWSVDDWRAIRNAVDPQNKTLWIEEGIDVSYLRVFDGHHLYSIAWSPNVEAELRKWPPRIARFGADKIWVATVMPGNDDLKTKRPDSYVRDRQNGEFYRQSWRAAFATYPDWIIITSYNEWVEGTMIEPSVTYGNLYLDITREYAAKFKAGLPSPTPAPTRTATPTATTAPTRTPTSTTTPTSEPGITPTTEPVSQSKPEPTATRAAPATITRTATPVRTRTPEATGTPPPPDGFRATVIDLVRVRAAPSTDAAILGRLKEGSIIYVVGRTEDAKWYQIYFPNFRSRGWIAGDLITTEPDNDAEPEPEATRIALPPDERGMP